MHAKNLVQVGVHPNNGNMGVRMSVLHHIEVEATLGVSESPFAQYHFSQTAIGCCQYWMLIAEHPLLSFATLVHAGECFVYAVFLKQRCDNEEAESSIWVVIPD